jgi:hypothetical protein
MKNITGWSSFQRIIGLMLTALFLVGCSAATSQPTESPAQASPTAQSEQDTQPDTTVLGALIADEPGVTVISADNTEIVLQKGETINIRVDDRITQEEGGHSVQRFLDDIEVELLRGVDILLTEARQESGGSIFVRFKLNHGHTHFSLNEQAIARAVVETDDVVITTREQGTEFFVCFAPGVLTCHPVSTGAIEVVGQGKQEIIEGGSASFTFAGESPQPPICAIQEELEAWLVKMRGSGDVQALGELVASWPQVPCGLPTQEPIAVEDTPMPPPDNPTPPPAWTPTATVPPGMPYVRINEITIDDQQHYVVAYETFEYTEQLPGVHVHFFFDTVTPENAGVPGSGPWFLYGGPRPFTQYTLHDRPAGASQMCALVANSDHSVQPNSGNCVYLPDSP